jgi:orotidine-5'-phosphate decarboxylase
MMFAIDVYANKVLDNLNRGMKEKDTLVCVGLDPDPSKIPLEIMQLDLPQTQRIFLFLSQVVDITADHVCAYKLQKAFYDDLEGGDELLAKTVGYIQNRHQEIPVFVDCKIGDTENTMNAYMHHLLDHIKADGIVVNPYMGDDVFQPFYQRPDKVALVLVQTSNPKAKVIQELKLSSGELLWERILQLTLNRWNQCQNLIPILSSNTEDYDYQSLRKMIPDQTPILLAGIGAQGGSLSVLRDLLNRNKAGVFVNSSRGILYSYNVDSKNWRDRILEETLKLKKQMNEIRYEVN